MFDGNEFWCKIWKKMTCAFKNDTRNLANFNNSISGSLKIVTLMRCFYRKYKMYELKIYGSILCHEKEEWCNLKEIDEFCPEHSKISKTFPLMCSFWPKYIMFEQKYRGVAWWHWILMQNLNENDLCFRKWHEEFSKIFTRAC